MNLYAIIPYYQGNAINSQKYIYHKYQLHRKIHKHDFSTYSVLV